MYSKVETGNGIEIYKSFEIVYEKSEFGNRFKEHKAFRIDTFQHSVVKSRKDIELIFFKKRFQIIP